MAKINILDSSIYNLISAGEVVERPASVVKELVENAVDAGAKNIKIEITGGGKNKIKVTDDGSGIDAADLEIAFLPHSTSKISNKDDLFGIKTLGFRGEALASIAAVSMITLISKTENSDTAHGLELQGGKVTARYETAGITGTSISVENLFYATPARLKFLKRDKSEELEISGLIASLILANPDIAFTYTADGKTIYQTQGNGLNNAVLSIYNREITMNFIEIENTYNSFSLSGYISKPTYFKGSRTYQTVVLNGRVITNKTITAAVEKAYEPFLMRRSYPLYVLNIKMPYDEMDINVHPSKFDVRFWDNGAVFSFVYHAVQRVLMTFDAIKELPQLEYIGDEDSPVLESSTEASPTADEEKYKISSKNSGAYSGGFGSFFKGGSLKDDGGAFYRILKNRMAAENAKKDETPVETVKKDVFMQESIEFSVTSDNETPFDFTGNVIGQVFDTYILVEKDDNLFIIDQHAAHERIIYDNLMDNPSVYSQPLLIPYIYKANPAEYDFLLNCVGGLNEIGFDITETSDLGFKVSAVPDALTDINFDKFFAYISKDLLKIDIKANDVLKEKLMQTACKSAVKGGDVLNLRQIEYLIRAFSEADKKPLQCPHGRPTVIKLPKSDFEKWFKRVL